MADSKVFTIKIDGLIQAHSDVMNLSNALNNLQDANVNVSTTIDNTTASINNATQAQSNLQSSLESVATSFHNLGNGISNTLGIASDTIGLFQNGISILNQFGVENESTRQSMETLSKIMATINTLQSINNTLLKEGGLITKIQTVATKALASAQKVLAGGINVATTATKGFKAALMSTGIGAIIVLIGSLIANFDKIKETVLEFIPELDNMGETFDNIKAILAGVGEAAINYILMPFKMVISAIKGWKEDGLKGALEGIKEEFIQGTDVVTNYQNGAERQRVENAKNAAKDRAAIHAEEFSELIKDNEAKYGSDWKYTEDGKKLYQDFFNAKLEMYDNDSKEYREVLRQMDSYNREATNFHNTQVKKRQDEWNSAVSKRKKDLEDLLKQLKEYEAETDRIVNESLQKDIDDEKKEIDGTTPEDIEALEEKTKKIAQVYDLQGEVIKQKHEKIKELEREQAAKLIAQLKKEGKKEEAARIENSLNTRLDEIEKDKQRELLENEEARNNALLNLDKRYNQKRQTDLEESIKTQNDLLQSELKGVDDFVKSYEEKFKNVVVRNNGIIDIKATKENIQKLTDTLTGQAKSLTDTKEGLNGFFNNLAAKYSDNQEMLDRIEGEREKSLGNIGKQSDSITKLLEGNMKKIDGLQGELFSDLNTKTEQYAEKINKAVSSIFDFFKKKADKQMEEAKENLERATEEYDKLVEKRTESESKIQALEEQAKNAKGGRLLVLQEQIRQEMEANKKLAAQEEELAKKKEAAEKEIAKKEKQQKRIELGQNIIQGIANTALAVTKVLPNVVKAAIVGAAGAIQVGIMTAQLAKLENGGLLRGKRHSQGGMRIEGSNIEVEGGEYVVNRESTAKNINLIKYINSQRRELKPVDLTSFFSKSSQGFEPSFSRIMAQGGQLPAFNTSVNMDNDQLIEAIQSIKIEPRVAVTDINTVQDNMVRVDSWTGM